GEEHDVPIGIGASELQRIRRRVDDPYVHASGFVLERAAVRSGHAHHVPEGSEDDVRLLCQCHAIINSSHGQHAHGTTRAVNQFDVGGEQISQAEAIDGVSVPAAYLHEAVMSAG